MHHKLTIPTKKAEKLHIPTKLLHVHTSADYLKHTILMSTVLPIFHSVFDIATDYNNSIFEMLE